MNSGPIAHGFSAPVGSFCNRRPPHFAAHPPEEIDDAVPVDRHIVMPDTPIYRRPLDLALVAFFAVSVLYGVLFSLPEGLGVPVSPDSPWPPLRALHDWAVAQEPAHLDPPPNLIAASLFDGFFQAPVLILVIVGLIRQRAWVRPLALFYSGAAVTNMFFYFTQTFLGPHPPPNVGYYLAFNLPWLIAPAALALRVLLAQDLANYRASSA